MPISLRKRVLLLLGSFCVGVAAAILSNCSDSTAPEEQAPTMKYRNEAEQVALWTSGTLRPQEWLVEQIDHELQLIRDTWAQTVPDARIQFSPPWVSAAVSVRADQWLYDQITGGTNKEWNRIVEDLHLKVNDPKWELYPRYLSLMPTTNLHPVRVAEHFVGFPGLEYVETGSNLQSWNSYFVRVTSDRGAKYFFKRCTCPDVYNAYSYLEVDDDSATFFGTHFECFDSIVVDPTWVSLERFQEIVDSLEAVRPAWVDSVRSAVWEFQNYRGFQWHRSQ